MNTRQSEPCINAAYFAVDALMQMDVSEDLLAPAITLPGTQEAKQQEFRLISEIRSRLGNPSVYAAIAHIYEDLSKSAAGRDDYLTSYTDNLRSLIENVRKNLANEAIDWARKQLENDTEEAASLCATEAGIDWMDKASDVLFCNPTTTNRRKKLDHHKERFFLRLQSKVPRIAESIEKQNVLYDRDECILLAITEIYGSFRPHALFALAMLYGYYIFLGLVIAVGGPEIIIEELSEITLLDDEDFSESVLFHSTVLQELGPVGRLLAVSDVDAAFDVGEVARDHVEACLSLASLFREEQSRHTKAERQWAQRERELGQTVSKQLKIIASLQQGNSKESTKGLLDELTSAKAEITALRSKLALSEERLAKLGSTRQERSDRVKADTASLPPAKTSMTPPPKEMSETDALNLLSSLKGVLIGGHATFHAKIAQALPGWKLFDADDLSIEEAHIQGADLVVFFTNHASHKQTQGALQKARRHAKPIVYAYKVNPPAFFVEVAKQAKRARLRRA